MKYRDYIPSAWAEKMVDEINFKVHTEIERELAESLGGEMLSRHDVYWDVAILWTVREVEDAVYNAEGVSRVA